MAAILENPCEYCGRKYVLRSGLTKHLRLCHPLGKRVVRKPHILKNSVDPLALFTLKELLYFSNTELDERCAALASRGEALEYERERIINKIRAHEKNNKLEPELYYSRMADLNNELMWHGGKQLVIENELNKIKETRKALRHTRRNNFDHHGIELSRCYSNMPNHYKCKIPLCPICTGN